MSELTHSVRPATKDDLEKILKIESEVHVDPWNLTHFEAELSKNYSQFWVVTDDETDEVVMGYIVFWILFDESQILNVATNLTHRGLGIAKYLIRKAKDYSFRKGVHRMSLEVRKSNTPAIELYQGLGFAITQVRKSFYPKVLKETYHTIVPQKEGGREAEAPKKNVGRRPTNAEDAFVMTLDLNALKVDF